MASSLQGNVQRRYIKVRGIVKPKEMIHSVEWDSSWSWTSIYFMCLVCLFRWWRFDTPALFSTKMIITMTTVAHIRRLARNGTHIIRNNIVQFNITTTPWSTCTKMKCLRPPGSSCTDQIEFSVVGTRTLATVAKKQRSGLKSHWQSWIMSLKNTFKLGKTCWIVNE